jgi:hypothetical protein
MKDNHRAEMFMQRQHMYIYIYIYIYIYYCLFCFTRAARDTVGCAMCSHVYRLRCNRKIRKYMYDAMQSLLNYSASCRIGAMLNTRNCEIIAKQCARAHNGYNCECVAPCMRIS